MNFRFGSGSGDTDFGFFESFFWKEIAPPALKFLELEVESLHSTTVPWPLYSNRHGDKKSLCPYLRSYVVTGINTVNSIIEDLDMNPGNRRR